MAAILANLQVGLRPTTVDIGLGNTSGLEREREVGRGLNDAQMHLAKASWPIDDAHVRTLPLLL